MSPMEKGNDKNSEVKCCLWNSEGKLAGLAEGPIVGISVWKSCFHSGKSFRCYRVLIQGRDSINRSIKLVPTVSLLPSPTKAKTVMLGNISSNLSRKCQGRRLRLDQDTSRLPSSGAIVPRAAWFSISYGNIVCVIEERCIRRTQIPTTLANTDAVS